MVKRELKVETSELFLTIAADKKTWQEMQKNVFEELKNNLIVKGYRKGKVPLPVAKKNITQKDIWSKAIIKMLDEMVKVASKSILKEDKILDSPTYSINKISDSELEVSFIYAIYPEIKISNYKKLNIKFEKESVNPELIKRELENLREKHALLFEKDGAITNGDLVTFDFAGYVDDKPFEGGKANDYILEIGTGRFIPGFEDQMLDLKIGDLKNINVNFPEDYHVENLKGKPAVFKIKINEIKTKQLPPLSDEFAKEIGIENVKNLNDLNKHLEKLFEEQTSLQAKNDFILKIFDEIKQKTKIIVPNQLIMREIEAITHHFENNLKIKKWTVDDYVKHMGTSKEKLIEEFRQQAEERLTDSFIFAEIARLENIKPSEEDFEIQYEKLAKMYKKSIDEIKKLVSKGQAQVPIINEKVIDFLIKTNA